MKICESSLIVEPKAIFFNPSPEELRKMVSEMPNARISEFDNYNVTTKVLSRSKASTFIITDNPKEHSGLCISTREGEGVAKLQDDFIRTQEMIVIDGYIGSDPRTRTAVRLIIEKRHANIAAMQQQLFFPVSEQDAPTFQPTLHVIYTPSLKAVGYPNDRLIAVDLDRKITRVFNSDYFGESKKGGLRMWNKLIYELGGLAMHAGCKIIPVNGINKTALIIGLSGTGKTTTTFTSQNSSTPVQDDFIALMEDGSCLASENGCFAKTFGLDKENEPTIHSAVTKRNAYLENVSMNEAGKVDFFDTSYTQNGRATFPFSSININATNTKKIDIILILNKNEDIIPAIAKLNPTQAVAYFMLGETMGTSAGGVEEAGKSLRIPGTNPFFPLAHGKQGERFLNLLNKHKIQVYLMNTGRIGGSSSVSSSKKIKIPHSSAIVKAIAEESIVWKNDPDFNYQIAENVPGFPEADKDLLQPRKHYQTHDKIKDYEKVAKQLKNERLEYLRQFSELPNIILDAIS